MQSQNGKTRGFYIELKSKRNLKNVTLTDNSVESFLLEGTIGEFVAAKFTEGVIFEVVGTEGVLRIDLCEGEIQKKSTELEVTINE
ncbi:MAG: hypothetical protein ACQCN5_08025 [Candidatus Bathyarchaeia archaeon]|jgi:hypothetical protein